MNLVSLDHDWTQITENESFPWEEMDGFFQNPYHPYGFDRHPTPRENSLDSIVYISVLDGGDGIVDLKLGQDYGSSFGLYNSYICDPNTLDTIVKIGYFSGKFTYTYNFTASVAENDSMKIALCRESRVGLQKVQELQIHPYKWKDVYDFYVYILGDKTDTSARHQLLSSTNFWEYYNHAFKQVAIKHGKILGEHAHHDKGYVHVIVEGARERGCIVNDDIDKAFLEMIIGLWKSSIIQIGYPTKRIWPLKIDTDNNNIIKLCGDPVSAQDPTLNTVKLELEPTFALDPKCPATIAKASVFWNDSGYWKLKYEDNRPEEIATGNNVNPNCVVFADADLGVYAGFDELGLTDPRWANGTISIIILPWNDDLTANVALHELGHAMGLYDLGEYGLSVLDQSLKVFYDEENLMHGTNASHGYKLRKRGIIIQSDNPNETRREYQWDCLHSVEGTCIRSPRY
ncbi:MAG: hypothetical protein FWC26_00045 [Fibromonadales bacterium]|nr:hypothetical protein [Fibromonadales bacterium]